MTIEVAGMMAAGAAALLAGLVLARPSFRIATGAGRILVFGPLCEAIALAIFAAEHFTAARDLAPLVPPWLPWHLFWVWFFGAALLAAAVSFLLSRCVAPAAAGLALFFLLIVVTLDLPGMPHDFRDRFYWILTFRETCFAAGAMVLAGSALAAAVSPLARRAANLLMNSGRFIVAGVMVFYAFEHFLHPRHVPGVPLEKLTPAWAAPVVLSWLIGLVLLLGGLGLRVRPIAQFAAASAGTALVLLTLCLYLPICIGEFHTNPVEGLNYVGDTLLFAATVLLAGLGAEYPATPEPSPAARPELVTQER